MTEPLSAPQLKRRLGVFDSVMIGLGSMIGAGIFAALAPAAAAAGGALLFGLAVAAVIAYCNANSSARLAALYPQSGGTYVYGRERLGPFFGYLAGWGFVVGKTASCAAMALTVGAYAWPGYEHVIAVVAVAVITAVNYLGVQKSAWATRGIVFFVLAVLALVVLLCLNATDTGFDGPVLTRGYGVTGVLQAAGLLFFAFAGYARIATLGEEVRDPRRTISRAIPLALAVTLLVYLLVAVAVLTVLGPDRLAAATDPLAEAVAAAGFAGAEPVVRVAAVVAALGSLLSLILGVSRTTFAMARDGNLPRVLDAVHPRYSVPHRAELAVGTVVAVLAATADLRGVIGFSSFAVLVYYLIANASAWTLSAQLRSRLVAATGAAGCLILAAFLPLPSVVWGIVVLGVGVAVYWVRAVVSRSRR
ncbi:MULTISPECIES: APC family permease [Rhodococcus]|uniref:Amino acid permease n=1 Tax=Rhodococcus oxybenzonivorans TaxID=1990687 RepID=A0AAE4UY37_9NOCA|nr:MULTISPECIES: amino acid permease [Rhodococcus]MDV7245819.1 amino acid permease [Rhodococcus oxybenzonivorans]MDV7264865.1 amino acid permease [Rhodococcus oxybenzonivorans]MDV7277377.1 amino acid permease [Rhodococcus oxybenzonivorans]MDV7336947.1 amino acid permease [Rhodococcus oxybenzonivorans]MDV7347089.1 amino acid permease [Rhodococcus oxybenzonivorans]